MQFAPLGNSGISASRIALGAWAIGGWMWGGQEDDESIKTIHAALDAGINFIDTAPMYGMGHSEKVVGRAIAEYAGGRDKVVLATKCGMRWDLDEPAGREFFRTDDDAIKDSCQYQVYIYNSPESIRHEVEQSLKRLQTDYIDLLQTHWQEETTPLEDTLAELCKLRDEGKIRAFGPCNASADQLRQYAEAGAASDQEKYSLLDRDAEADHLPICREKNMAFLAYSPLANGLLTGKMGPDRKFPPDDLRAQRPRFSVESRKLVQTALDKVQPIAEAHDCTLAQLMIAWTLAQPGVTHPLVGARHIQQARENAAAADIELTEQQAQQIDDACGDLASQLGGSGPPAKSR